MNTIWHYSPLLAALLTPIFAANADELQAQQYGDFTDYVLALSWQTGFCQSQHERRHREPDECRLQKEPANKADFLTVHGLWRDYPNLSPHAVLTRDAGSALVVRRGQSRICLKSRPAGNAQPPPPDFRLTSRQRLRK